jgi:hypothetical protein
VLARRLSSVNVALFANALSSGVIGLDQTSWKRLDGKLDKPWQMWCITAPGVVCHRIRDDKEKTRSRSSSAAAKGSSCAMPSKLARPARATVLASSSPLVGRTFTGNSRKQSRITLKPLLRWAGPPTLRKIVVRGQAREAEYSRRKIDVMNDGRQGLSIW